MGKGERRENDDFSGRLEGGVFGENHTMETEFSIGRNLFSFKGGTINSDTYDTSEYISGLVWSSRG